jgi:glutamine cyclotransferase
MTNVPKDHARQAFGRGLCMTKEGLAIGGSSPSTITAYDLESGKIIKSLNLTMDVRNSIHGLEIWPF